MEDYPLSSDPTVFDGIASDRAITVWMLKWAIPCLRQPMELLSPYQKSGMNELACMVLWVTSLSLLIHSRKFSSSRALKGLQRMSMLWFSVFSANSRSTNLSLWMWPHSSTIGRSLRYHYFSTLFNPLLVLKYMVKPYLLYSLSW